MHFNNSKIMFKKWEIAQQVLFQSVQALSDTASGNRGMSVRPITPKKPFPPLVHQMRDPTLFASDLDSCHQQGNYKWLLYKMLIFILIKLSYYN